MAEKSKGPKPTKRKKTSVRNRPVRTRFFKKPRGQEPSWTPELQATLIRYLATGAYVETAACAAGICRKTFQLWVKRGGKGEEPYASMLRAIEAAQERSDVDALESITRCGYGIREKGPDGEDMPGGKWVLEPDWKALAYRLGRRSTAQQERKDALELERMKLENENLRTKLNRLLTGLDSDPTDPEMVELQKAKLKAEVERLKAGDPDAGKNGTLTLTVVLEDFPGSDKGQAA